MAAIDVPIRIELTGTPEFEAAVEVARSVGLHIGKTGHCIVCGAQGVPGVNPEHGEGCAFDRLAQQLLEHFTTALQGPH